MPKLIPLAGKLKGCVHSLATREDIKGLDGRTKTITFAMPCQSKHIEDLAGLNKGKPQHVTATGVVWS
jgi:hypothetical protein